VPVHGGRHIELALTPDPRWEADTATLVAAAKEAGFSALGLAQRRATEAAASAYRSSAVRCHELLALIVRSEAVATEDAASRLAEAAAVVGAEWILTVVEPPLDSAVARTLRRCADAYAEGGAKMALEFCPLSPVDSVGSCLEAAAAAGRDRAGIVIDTSHFCCGVSSWEDLAGVSPEQIAYVQFTDVIAPDEARPADRPFPRRALPGEGDLDLARFADTLRGRGWAGTVSVEVINRASRDLPVDEFARRAAAATRPYWA
jgi:sugar phosphate isomerase/epimerase